jgi:pimeloyl-ACP methyl ester carboxylesterase
MSRAAWFSGIFALAMRLVLLFAAVACAATPPPASTQVTLTACRLKSSGVPARCGTLRVPEDRAHPEKRQIELRIAVVPALAREPAPDPLFLLAGGPGQAATEALGPLLGAFERVRRTRDLVLVDQRGTGSSNPLRCDLNEPGAPLAERLRADSINDAKFKKCLAGYPADPRFYTSAIAMQDLDDVRAALGYARINLWGGSYGTRAALVYLRDHGPHARTAILDGVAPPQLVLPLNFAADAQRSVDLLFAQCAADPSCAQTFPKLAERFKELLASLSAKPAKAHVQDPLSGEWSDVELSHEAFTSGLRGVLYQQDLASLVPLMIDRAAKGDFAPFIAGTAGLDTGFSRSMSLGMTFSVVCSEDLRGVTVAQADEAARGTFLGPHVAREFLRICSFWPRGEAPPQAPIHSEVPTLLLSGELDPATPPKWADIAAETLPNSARFVVPGVGHGATSEGCVPQLIAQFLEKADVKALDASCLGPLKRPPFFVSFAGPTP